MDTKPTSTPPFAQRLSMSLYVSDLVTQFAKQLGVKALHYDGFEKVLAGEAPLRFVRSHISL